MLTLQIQLGIEWDTRGWGLVQDGCGPLSVVRSA